MGKKLLLLIAALLVGAGGLGLEVVVTNLSGITIGYGRSAPVGIGVYISGWALGAWFAGTFPGRDRWLWLGAGAALILVGCVGPSLLVWTAGATTLPAVHWGVTLLVLLAAAFPQGLLLPLLSRHWSLGSRGDLGWLFGANLLGAALGAATLADMVPALWGRGVAGAMAGVCGGLVALVGGLIHSPGTPAVEDPGVLAPEGPTLSPWRAGVLLAIVTGWIGTLEWFGVRLGVLWFGGMQATLGSILVASMIALGLGAMIMPRILPRDWRGLVVLGILCVLSSSALFLLPLTLPGTQGQPLLWRALVLMGPVLIPFGGWVPVLHRLLGGASAPRLGRLLGWEALGVAIGLPLSHLVLLPLFGMNVSLACWGIAGAWATGWFLPRWRLVGVVTGTALIAIALSSVFPRSPALDSPPLANPSLELLATHEDEHFLVSVVEDGLLGERTLLTDGFRAAASGRDYDYMRALGHLPLLLHPEPRRVGVLAFGTGTTAGSVSLHPEVEQLEVLELSESVTDFASYFEEVNRGVLDDPRSEVLIGDGRHTLGDREKAYDVLTMEPLLPNSPFGVYLYTREFYDRARSSLEEGGLLCQWVPPHALEPEVFDAVLGAFAAAFEWSSVWVFGTQVILIGSKGAVSPSAQRFSSDSEELVAELAALGLDSLEGLLARYVVPGKELPRPARALRDLDPWVIYRPHRPGGKALGDLPRNLAKLRSLAQPIPLEWWLEVGPEAEDRMRGLALVREAREAFALERANALGVQLPEPGLASGSRALLDRAAMLVGNDPGLLRLEMEIEFVEGLQQAKLLLARDGGREGAAAAAALLSRCGALRPERADVRAYLSVALERLGSQRAARELERALELCPGLLETRVGQQLRVWER